MSETKFQKRLERCAALMQGQGFDALILTKPANMFYLTGDGRLCAYAFITSNGSVNMGVPKTDVEEVSQSTGLHDVLGFEDEIGMIHSIAHCFEHSGIRQGTVGLEYAFLP
jgi:Xaa-Pro aminopeptidase